MGYTHNLMMLLPLPFRRGEGRGEESLCIVYPTVLSVRPLINTQLQLGV